jgi:hypothetical protein
MGAEILFAAVLAILFTVLGSSTVYQAVMLKTPVVQKDGTVQLKQMTPDKIFQVTAGSLYILMGVLLLVAMIPSVRGNP